MSAAPKTTKSSAEQESAVQEDLYSRTSFIRHISHMQRSIKAGKSNFNDFGNYCYRSTEDILCALKPYQGHLAIFIDDAIVEHSGRIYVRASVTVTDGVNEHTVSAFARESEQRKGMDPSQCTGASSSYAAKYALCRMFMIDNTIMEPDQMDNRQAGQRPPPPPPEETISEHQADQLYQAMSDADVEPRKFLQTANVDNINNFPASRFMGAMKWLAEKAEKDR